MKKKIWLLLVFISLVMANCTPSTSFEDKVATQVAVSFTATALDEMLKKPTDTPMPVVTGTPLPTPTEPLPEGDPKNDLGTPNWRDDLSTGKNWNLESSDVVFGSTTFSARDGKLVASSANTSGGYIWWLNFRRLKNAYLEAKFEVDTCSGGDRYGLVFRAANYEDGHAYYYSVSCNGTFELRRVTPSGSTFLLGNPESDRINTGSNQTNTLGVWMQEERISLYVNGQLLREISDKELNHEGHFGVFINAVQTPGFTVRMDEIAYWLFD